MQHAFQLITVCCSLTGHGLPSSSPLSYSTLLSSILPSLPSHSSPQDGTALWPGLPLSPTALLIPPALPRGALLQVMDISMLPAASSPADLSQNRRGEVIGASVPLLILPTLAVALRFLSRWSSRAGFWVRYLICSRIGEGMTHQLVSGTIWPSCPPAYVPSGRHLDNDPYSYTQFLCWGPNIVNLVGQSHPAS